MSDSPAARAQTFTAFFDERSVAQKAIDDLVAAGIPNEQIHLAEGSGTTVVGENATATARKGFWDELKDLFLPEQDRRSYAEGLSRGGFLLSVQVVSSDADRARDILDAGGAVDMDAREAEWTAGGWSHAPAPASLVALGAMGESELLGEAAAPRPPSMVRDPNAEPGRLRSYTVQNDLEPGFPSDR